MEDAEDLLAKYCIITVSQEEKLRICGYAGASPEISDSDSSSPEEEEEQPAIFMVSPPASPESGLVDRNEASKIPPDHAASSSQPYLSGSGCSRPPARTLSSQNGNEEVRIEVIDLDSEEDGEEEGLGKEKTTVPECCLRDDNGGFGKRKLPWSMRECEKGSNGVMKNGPFKDLVEVAQTVLEKVSDGSHGGESVSLLETAERHGWVFPRPRWWPPEGFNDGV